MIRHRLLITGRVQGVSYRAWFVERARALGLDGWVRNRADGSVEAVIGGSAESVAAMVAAARQGPPAARVAGVAIDAAPDGVGAGFEQRSSV